jgi:hypothetical protein
MGNERGLVVAADAVIIIHASEFISVRNHHGSRTLQAERDTS